MTSSEPRILKAKDLRGAAGTIVFNFEDLRRRCDEHVEKVRGETRRMIEAAHAEADRIRRQAHADAREEGRRQGLSDAEAEIVRRSEELAEELTREKLKTVLPALNEAVQALVRERDRWRSEWEAGHLPGVENIHYGLLVDRQIVPLAAPFTDCGRPEGGRIAVGAPADLVAVHANSVRTAGCEPAQIVFAATSSDVHTVVNGGRIVVESGRHHLSDTMFRDHDGVAHWWMADSARARAGTRERDTT
jgi:vacuolar-type H+-ATPase subunit H